MDAFGLVTFLVLAVPVLVIGLICPLLPALRELDEEPAGPTLTMTLVDIDAEPRFRHLLDMHVEFDAAQIFPRPAPG